MRLIKGLFFGTFIALFIGFLVSFFPKGESPFASNSFQESHLVEPVFNPNKPILLTRDTLVSYLKQIPLHFFYKQVELDDQALFIKLSATYPSTSDLNEVQEQIFQDVFQLLDTLYRYTTNVNQVYIRFIHEHQGSQHDAPSKLSPNKALQKTLLLSIESQRENFELESLQADLDQQELEAFITAKTKIIYGTGWNFEKIR